MANQIDNTRHATRTIGTTRKAKTGTKVVKIQRSNISNAVNLNEARTTAFIRLLPIQGDDTIYEFHFPFSPINISYDGLANEIAEIDRPGATSILAFKKHQLMKVSFDFVVAVPYDGINTSIDSDLFILRTMAESTTRPVRVFNLDQMFERTSRRKYQPANTRHTSYQTKFRIAEFNVTSVKRNMSGSITQADCKITLIEDVNPKIDVALIPRFIPPPTIPKKATTTTKGKTKTVPKASTGTEAMAKSNFPWVTTNKVKTLSARDR
jgi:hypothetical protein